MKLMLCRACGDVVLLHPAPRSCLCGAATGRYLEDRSTVEQTAGTLSIALQTVIHTTHNHNFRFQQRPLPDFFVNNLIILQLTSRNASVTPIPSHRNLTFLHRPK